GLGWLEGYGLSIPWVVHEDGRRVERRRVAVVDLGTVLASVDAGDRSAPGKGNLSLPAPTGVEQRQTALHVVEIFDDDPAANQRHAPDRILVLRHHCLPVDAPGVAQVYGDHFAIRRIAVGAQVYDRPDIAECPVLDFVFLDDRPDRRPHVRTLRVLQVRVVEAVPGPGAPGHAYHQIAPVFRDPAADEPRRQVLPLVDQDI